MQRKTAKVEIVCPNQNKLDDMTGKLSEFSAEEIKDGITNKTGEAFDILCERGEIIKKNYKNRLEIAKLSVIISMLKDEKTAVSDAVKLGAVENNISITLEEKVAKNLVRFMRRCGIGCDIQEGMLVPNDSKNEECIELATKSVWVDLNTKEKLRENLEKMKEVNTKIQLMNAVRYVKKFSEEEEKDFEEFQGAYLNLLKEQDELLKEFNDEERLSVNV